MIDKQNPRVFFSYSHKDSSLADQLAESLQSKGVVTWLDKWCIGPGDSLRQKIDEGIGDCTHFLVLLTQHSIDSEWVKQEMDAGFVRKLKGECRFIPVRYELPVGKLPPNLQGMLSPEIKRKERELSIEQLINDIRGVSRKPPLGASPVMVLQKAKEAGTGYSPAVSAVAQLFVERSQHGLKHDPRLRVAEILKATGLAQEDVEDAYHELADDGFVEPTRRGIGLKVSDPSFTVSAQPSLFIEFDSFWMGWNPVEDGVQIATDIINNPNFPNEPAKIAAHYNWKPRRLNPAICYLEGQELVKAYQALGNRSYCFLFIEGNRSRIRRLIKSIS